MDPLHQPFMPQANMLKDPQPNSRQGLVGDFFGPSPDLASLDVRQGIKQERAEMEIGRSKPASPSSSLGAKSPTSPQGMKQLIRILRPFGNHVRTACREHIGTVYRNKHCGWEGEICCFFIAFFLIVSEWHVCGTLVATYVLSLRVQDCYGSVSCYFPGGFDERTGLPRDSHFPSRLRFLLL
jgi:hypothetical protein